MNAFKLARAKSPEEYILILDEPRRAEINNLYKFIKTTLPSLPVYMQSSMISFGSYYSSELEEDRAIIALASREDYISIYVRATDGNTYLAEAYKEKFPQADIGKSCIRIKKVEDIDLEVLSALLQEAVALMAKN